MNDEEMRTECIHVPTVMRYLGRQSYIHVTAFGEIVEMVPDSKDSSNDGEVTYSYVEQNRFKSVEEFNKYLFETLHEEEPPELEEQEEINVAKIIHEEASDDDTVNKRSDDIREE